LRVKMKRLPPAADTVFRYEARLMADLRLFGFYTSVYGHGDFQR